MTTLARRPAAEQPETVWMYDNPESLYHDHVCLCSRHCRNCRQSLTGSQRLYCSAGCGQQYRQAVRFDARMSGTAYRAPSGVAS
jgi:hypothetical protein